MKEKICSLSKLLPGLSRVLNFTPLLAQNLNHQPQHQTQCRAHDIPQNPHHQTLSATLIRKFPQKKPSKQGLFLTQSTFGLR